MYFTIVSFEKLLTISIRALLLLTAFTPIVFASKVPFPFVFGKMIFFRTLVESALILALAHVIYGVFSRGVLFGSLKRGWGSLYSFIRQPLVCTTILFFVSLVLSTIFAENRYRAFWGDLERGEGLVGLLHFAVFIGLSVSFFGKKDWLNYFKLSLFAGFILIFYGVLQYLEVTSFPFVRPPAARPDSYVGNAAFLSTHMFFLIMFAVLVIQNVRRKGFWYYTSLLIIPLSVVTMFLTGTRGAILGLVAGVVFLLVYFSVAKGGASLNISDKLALNLRLVSIILLVAGIIFASLFWLTRSAAVWQSIPGLDRLARTAALDVSDPSTQTRIITWEVSLRAFKERPIFGWGPENYLVAYEKHYDPDYALYGETWLDRAHSKPLDLLVMHGLFGFLSYFGILGAMFYELLRRQNGEDREINYRPFLAAGIFAYAIQNLVLFDQINSYAAFFALLAFLISVNFDMESFANKEGGQSSRKARIFVYIILSAAILGVLYLFYASLYVPYKQAKALRGSPGLGNVDLVVAKLKEAFYPYNYAQNIIRSNGFDTVYRDQYFFNDSYRTNPSFKPLGDLWLGVIGEILDKEPYDLRMFVRMVEMLDVMGRDDESNFKKAEDVLRRALEISATRQEIYYHLALNLAKQNRLEEALVYAKRGLDLSPGVARAHYHHGLILAAAGRDAEAQAEFAKAEEISPSFQGMFATDMSTLLMLYSSWNRRDKIAELALKTAEGIIDMRLGQKHYEIALYEYLLKEDADKFVKIALMLAKDSNLKEDMEVLIDLAKHGKWQIIKNLIIE